MSRLKLFIGLVFVSLLWIIASPQSTEALNLNPDPGTGGMPSNLRTSLRNCDTSGNSPGFEQWVSKANAPITLAMNVEFGTPSISLDYHFSGAICYSNNDVTNTNAQISNPRAFLDNFPLPGSTFTEINTPKILPLSWGTGSYQQVGAYRHSKQNFRFSPPGGFTKSGTYKIQVDQKAINSFFSSGIFGCIPVGTASGLNDFNSCPNATPTFSIEVTVTNQPKFDHRAQIAVRAQDGSPVDSTVVRGQTYTLFPYIKNQGPETAAGSFEFNLLGVQHKNTARTEPVFPGDGTGIGSLLPVGNQASILGKKKDYISSNPACEPNNTTPSNCWVWGVTNLEPTAQADSSFKFKVKEDATDGQACFLPFARRRGVNTEVWTGTEKCFTIGTVDSNCPAGSQYSGPLAEQPDRDGDGNVGNDRDDCNDPAEKSYLSVYGNDVIAGGGFGSVCENVNDEATIESYASGSGTTWKGASSQLAAFALGSIENFYTGNMRGLTTSPQPPLDLTFGNTANGNSKVAMNAGGFSGHTNCIPDYFANRGNNPVLTGDQTIATKSIADGTKEVLYYQGDVHITGTGISFNNTNWNNIASIPSFYLIVQGNIFINPSVTRLDGVYIAQPDEDGNGGEIVTCAVGHRNFTPPGNACDKQLEINGAFIAKQVRFKRSHGTLTAALPNEGPGVSNAGEVFKFSPETYLSPLNSSLERSLPFTKYDYITSLPPIL